MPGMPRKRDRLAPRLVLAAGPDAALLDLCGRYHALGDALAAVPAGKRRDADIERLGRPQADVKRRITDTPAHTNQGRRAKAAVLCDWLGDRSGDPLLWSLVDDLMRIAAA